MVLDFSRPFDLHTSDPSRVWIIPQGDDAPIVIHAAIHRGEEWGEFGGRLDALIASIELGERTPVDILVTEVGAARRPDAELVGRPAVVVEMLGVRPNTPVFRHVALPADAHPGVAVWYTQDDVELWAIDTDASVLIVTAEAANHDELAIALELL